MLYSFWDLSHLLILFLCVIIIILIHNKNLLILSLKITPPISAYLKSNYGIQVKIGEIHWFTKRYNKTLFYIGTSKKKFFHIWFGIGVIAGITCSIFTISMIVWNIINYFFITRQETVIKSLLPGINFPFSLFPFTLIAIFINMIYHELGHALAITSESIQIHGFGIDLFILLPNAYIISTSKDHVSLRIICGGIWHNLTLLLICILLSHNILFIFSPIFKPSESGVIVSQSPPIPNKLKWGDKIVSVNGIQIKNREDLVQAIINTKNNKDICVSKLIPDYEDKHCCDNNSTNANTICWKTPDDQFCANISTLYTSGPKYCSNETLCNENEICVTPQLNSNETIYLFSKENGEETLLISTGSIPVGFSSVEPRWSWLSNKSVILLDLVEQFLFCMKLVAFGFVITNCLPIKKLDGEYLYKEVISFMFSSWSNERKAKILSYILTMGMTLTFISLGLSIFSTLYNNIKG